MNTKKHKIIRCAGFILAITLAFFISTSHNLCAKSNPASSSIDLDDPASASTGLGNAASAILDDYSPDSLMDDLFNSPFLTEDDKAQLANMSAEEQEELFSSVVNIFNDPEFQAVLNDPVFMQEMEKLNEMIESGEIDFDDNLYNDTDDFDDKLNTVPDQPTKVEPKPITPEKPTADSCKNMVETIQSIIKQLHSLEQKGSDYEFIKQYFSAYKSKINTFIFYLEMLQKSKNIELLADDKYASLNRALCTLSKTLNNEVPQIPLATPLDKNIYNPYEILGLPQSATNDEIKKRFQELSLEKKPSNVFERLQAKKLDKHKITKKIKKAELAFAPIKKAYSDLLDPKYRKEVDRIINAEKTKQETIEELTQLSIWNAITALDETISSPGTTLLKTEELLKEFDEKAVEERKKREEEEAKTAKKIEEFGRKVGRPSPIPREQSDSYFGGGYHRYDDDFYGQPGRSRGPDYSQTPSSSQPSGMSNGGPRAQKDGKRPDDKKLEGAKSGDSKKPEAKKPTGEMQPTKAPETADDVTKSIKKLDDLLNTIEKGKEDKPKEPAAKPPKKENGDKDGPKEDTPKKAPEKPKGPSQEDKKKLAQEFQDITTFLSKGTQTKSIKSINDVEDSLKKMYKRLSFRKIKDQIDETQESIDKFNKIKGMKPQIMRMRVQEHKKAFDSLKKNHKLLLEKFKEVSELTSDKAEKEEVKKRFFGSTQQEVVIEPTSKLLKKMQKNIGTITEALQKMELEIDPIEKKKREEEAKKKATA